MDKNETRILTFASAGHFFTHFFMLVYPVLVMPLSRELQLPLETILNQGFLLFSLYGILAIPWGLLSDIIDQRIIMGAGLILAGTGYILAGSTGDINLFPVFLGMVGAGCSAYHPSGLALISKGIKQRGKAMGINGVWGNLGIAGAPFAGGILVFLLGWQTTLIIFGTLGMLVGITSLLVPFKVDRHQDTQKSTILEKNIAVKLFFVLCGVMVFSGLLYRGFTVILPTFLEYKLADLFIRFNTFLDGFTDLTNNTQSLGASVIAGIVYIIGIGGQILGGYIADKKDLRLGYFIFYGCALPFLCSLYFLDGIWVIISAGIYIFCSLGMQPIENSLFAVLTPPKWRSLSYGIKFTIVFGIGSFSVFLVNHVQKTIDVNTVILLLSSYLAGLILTIGVLTLLSRKQKIEHIHK